MKTKSKHSFRIIEYIASILVIPAVLMTLFTTTQVHAASSGILWSSQEASDNNMWRSIAWSPELNLYVAVAGGGTNRVMTSPDGINWATHPSARDSNTWSSVAWSPELNLFVAVAAAGTDRIMTSPDGVNWTGITAPSDDAVWASVMWAPDINMFVATATSGSSRLMTSPDGVNWTNQTTPSSSGWNSVAWSPELGLLVAVAVVGTDRVMTSPDGVNWTARSASASGWQSVTWSPDLNLFVAVAISGTDRIMTSPDGINWTPRSAPEANQWRRVKWSPGYNLFVALAGTGTNRIMTSPDGVNWTGQPATGDNFWEDLVWSPEQQKFVATALNGSSGYVMTSALASVSTQSASALKQTEATLHGSLDFTGSISEVSGFFRYRVAGSTDPFTNTPAQTLTATGSFSQTITSLRSDTTYEYFTVISNGRDPELTGSATTFTTAPASANPVTPSAPSSSPDDSRLADTGQNMNVLIALITALLASGTLILFRRYRRTT